MKSLDSAELLSSIGPIQIRLLAEGDEKHFLQFANSLSAESKILFAPYKWNTSTQEQDYCAAIANCSAGNDLSFLLFNSSKTPIGHLALWGVKQKNRENGMELIIPTLGICIADSFQGKGLGKIGVNFLQKRAREMKADAIELTFAPWNERAGNLYRKCGFEEMGMLNIPLGVNPAIPNADVSQAKEWRKERHMVYPINLTHIALIKSCLKNKENAPNHHA